jgi:hypothetical protein
VKEELEGEGEGERGEETRRKEGEEGGGGGRVAQRWLVSSLLFLLLSLHLPRQREVKKYR